MEIGNIIKSLRKEAGLTQTELANKLGTTQDTVSLWELDKSLPDLVMFVKLCKIFNVSANYILDLD